MFNKIKGWMADMLRLSYEINSKMDEIQTRQKKLDLKIDNLKKFVYNNDIHINEELLTPVSPGKNLSKITTQEVEVNE